MELKLHFPTRIHIKTPLCKYAIYHIGICVCTIDMDLFKSCIHVLIVGAGEDEGCAGSVGCVQRGPRHAEATLRGQNVQNVQGSAKFLAISFKDCLHVCLFLYHFVSLKTALCSLTWQNVRPARGQSVFFKVLAQSDLKSIIYIFRCVNITITLISCANEFLSVTQEDGLQ